MADVISAPLEFLFNLLFFQAVVPRSWRHAYVIPIRKKPPYCDPENYHVSPIRPSTWVQSKKSTVTLMLEAMNDWTSVLDRKKSPIQSYSHKLARIGVHGRIVKWIEEFLADRTFQVLVNGHASTVRHASSGVPQGSVLPPPTPFHLIFYIFLT
ncbi:hypothetical protein COOONC_26107 [Cooperia oncophora]